MEYSAIASYKFKALDIQIQDKALDIQLSDYLPCFVSVEWREFWEILIAIGVDVSNAYNFFNIVKTTTCSLFCLNDSKGLQL